MPASSAGPTGAASGDGTDRLRETAETGGSTLAVVHVATSPLARVRAFELTPAAFRRVAAAAAIALWVIVATGAAVRLTGSGLGCEHWPGCTAGDPFPARGIHSFIEFSNRVVAFFTIMLTLAAWLAARRTPGLPRWAVRLGLATFLGTLAQAPLGYITVKLKLHPLIVMTHLLLSMLVLAGGVVLLLEALGLEHGHAPAFVSRGFQRLWLGFAAATFALILSGTFATAAGPHSGGDHVKRFGTFQTSLHVHAYVVAAFTLTGAVAFAWLGVRAHWFTPGLRRLATSAVGLLALQIGLGELQYRTHLPWGVVLAHVAVSAAVWASVVALATLFLRPLAPLAPHRMP
jgi:cytochrome c oxidase assembly protein subunit 15